MIKLIKSIFLSIALIALPVCAEEDTWQYTFAEGDTLWDVSHNFLKDWRLWQKLQELNGIDKDTGIRPGTEITIPVQWLDMQNAPVNIVNTSGQVKLLNESGDAVEIEADHSVSAGYALQTGEASTALLVFADGSKLLVQQDTFIRFKTTAAIGSGLVYNYEIALPKGGIENRANPQRTPGSTFLVETPASTTATKGTVYRVRVNGDTTGTEVTQGRVAVANDMGQVGVKQGFGVKTEKGKAPTKPVKLLDAPELEDDLGRFRYLPSEVAWQAVAGAKLYRVQLSLSEAFDLLTYDISTPNQTLVLPLALADGKYYMRVRGIDTTGLEGRDAYSSFVVAATPLPAAHIKNQSNARQYRDQVTLQWTEMSGAKAYVVEVLLGSDERALVHRSPTIRSTQYQFALDALGSYQWRVTGISEQGELGPTGHLGRFSVVERPYRPEKKQVQAASLLIEWPYVPEGKRLNVQLATDAAFENISYQKIDSGELTEIGVLPAGDYYLRYQVLSTLEKVSNVSPVHKVRWRPKL